MKNKLNEGWKKLNVFTTLLTNQKPRKLFKRKKKTNCEIVEHRKRNLHKYKVKNIKKNFNLLHLLEKNLSFECNVE